MILLRQYNHNKKMSDFYLIKALILYLFVLFIKYFTLKQKENTSG